MASVWNWADVLQKAIVIGLAFFLFNVGVGKCVTLFLSYLNEALEPYPLEVTTVQCLMFNVLCSTYSVLRG